MTVEDEARAIVVGPHDPIFLSTPRLGHWIECECGWISPGFYLPSRAVEAHQRHVAEVTSWLTA